MSANEPAEAVVTGPIEVDADGTWHYLHIPVQVRAAWAHRARRGSIRVTASLGPSTWEGSLLPWADGSAQLSVSARIRKARGLVAGDEITVILRPKD